MNYKKLNESKELKKELDAFYDAGNKKIIVPAKKMLKIAAADVRSRGSVAWGGKKARNVARFA
ncbi:MAG: hypothetical protein HN962_01245 [Actinobacteria bacterium]|jgi:peptidyl-tRNA hydrolase|nr:hypothetical protein [Actinomycetota bacterium]|tara:strand:- start:355 stop:543 length:189 start_codon:yes stop_codon:yes gene_type:complete